MTNFVNGWVTPLRCWRCGWSWWAHELGVPNWTYTIEEKDTLRWSSTLQMTNFMNEWYDGVDGVDGVDSDCELVSIGVPNWTHHKCWGEAVSLRWSSTLQMTNFVNGWMTPLRCWRCGWPWWAHKLGVPNWTYTIEEKWDEALLSKWQTLWMNGMTVLMVLMVLTVIVSLWALECLIEHITNVGEKEYPWDEALPFKWQTLWMDGWIGVGPNTSALALVYTCVESTVETTYS